MTVKKQQLTDKAQQDSDDGSLRFSFRLTKEESERLKQLQVALQADAGKYSRITQRVVFLEALDALEWRMREKARKRKSGIASKED